MVVLPDNSVVLLREKSSNLYTTVIVVALLILALSQSGYAQSSSATKTDDADLRAAVDQLKARVAELERKLEEQTSKTDLPTPQSPAQAEQPSDSVTTAKPELPGILQNTTINFALDGYYGYNFNHPIGRVNLLRAYAVSSNSFSLNQVNLILEHAPDVSQGRRFGARVDFQYGQATETVQGSAVNELRPQAYRPLFQAYGTYVAPLGSGLTVDFGKWASSLGVESNYAKDQMNYSRSYYFIALPDYHTGVRATYEFSPKLSLSYWLVNGIQQTEDFNGFKSQAFIFTIKPKSTVSWNVNYYFGQEQADVVPVLNPTFPTAPTQPGLPTQNISPAPNGREHIFDTYATWSATPKLTLAAEGDYVINRGFQSSAPKHVAGGAAYARYQFAPKFALATRFEYLSDRGGLFSGVTQALKENTVTAEYKLAEGFLMRTEWRKDYSNRPFFLTDVAGALKNNQNTATLGLLWWFGQKEGAW